MIDNYLPDYYAAFTNNPSYETIESFEICGHEVAWMHYSGYVTFGDPDTEDRIYQGYELKCECDFTENVGWKIFSGQPSRIGGRRACSYFQTAMYLRQLELRSAYVEQFDSRFGDSFVLKENIAAITLDLIERVKRHEFIGSSGAGASFYGGYYYLQTLAGITDQYVGHLWEPMYQLCKKRLISLDGAVVKDYEKPPPPKWIKCRRIERTGYIGIASLPGNRHMHLEWKFEITGPDGTPTYSLIPGLALGHDPVFGPDAEDIAAAETRLIELIDAAIENLEKDTAGSRVGGEDIDN